MNLKVSLQPKYQHILTQEKPQLVIAFSGGIDSTTLLHYYVGFCQQYGLAPPKAVHINHGLQCEANTWAQHCQTICKAWGISIAIETVQIPAPDTNIEAQARAARYRALSQYILPNHWLLTAHHLDDQIETFFLNLLRGSGLDGLAAMPETKSFAKGLHVRPLLKTNKSALNAYAQFHKLQWVQDPSNQHCKLRRNALRQQLMSLETIWPQYRNTMARTMGHIQQQLHFNELYIDVTPMLINKYELDLSQLKSRPLIEQRLLLRHWLKIHDKPMPSEAVLNEILAQCVSRQDKQPHYRDQSMHLRRYQNRLYLDPPTHHIAHLKAIYQWHLHTPLLLPFSRLTAIKKQGKGLLKFDPMHASYQVRFRQPGIRFRAAGRQGSHPLKKCMQAWKIPPWMRATYPLIFDNQDRLIAVPNHAIAHEAATQSDTCWGWDMQLTYLHISI